jgi:Cu/Ag efflux pump CusA
MRSVIKSSLRLSVLILVAVGVLVAVAVTGTGRSSVDTLPEFLPTQVQIQTEALGLSASEVEQFITVPLEDEFNGVPYVDHMRSQSMPGLSAITLTFKTGTDLYAARQLVTERIAQGPSVVRVGTPPVMLEPLSAEQRVMMISLTSKTVPLTDLSTQAFWRLRPRLLSVPGVANVSIWGQRDVQLQVLFDPVTATKAGVTLEQVLNTAGDATWTSPLSFLEASSPGADGLVDMPNQRLTVQHVLPIRDPGDLARVPVEDTPDGKIVLLGQVATIVQDHPPLRGDAVVGTGPGLIMVIEKLPGASTLSVTKGIETAMADMRSGLTGVDVDTTVFRPATYVETALHNIGLAALIGFLLLAVWLGISTRSWRVPLIGVVSIVVPIVGALVVLSAFGATYNLMTLVGLVIALGVVVDDAVVGTGTVKRYLEQHAPADGSPPDASLVVDAYAEVRRPLAWAVAVLLFAELPLLLIGGVTGAFVQPIVVAYSLVVLASTAAALVITPVLAGYLLRRARPARPAGRPAAEPSRVRRASDAAGAGFIRRPVWAYLLVIVLAAVGVAGLLVVRRGPLVPALQDRDLLVRWQGAPGTSITEMDRITERAGEALRATSGVRDVASHVGQALLGDQVVGSNSAETWIALEPDADYASTLAAVRRALSANAGVSHTLLTYPQASLDAAPVGNGKAITVRVYGTDTQVLEAKAKEVQRSIAAVQGVEVDPKVAMPTVEPAVQIQTNVSTAARYGLKPGDVRRQTAVMIAGIPVGSYYHDQQIFDVTVWSVPRLRQNVADVGKLLIATPAGGQVPLDVIASVTVQPSPTEIDHDRASRYVDVTADYSGSDVSQAIARASEDVRAIRMPLGYHAEVSSDLQAQENANLYVWLAALGVVIAIYLLLQAVFGSWRRSTLLFFTLPLAVVGMLPAMLLIGAPFSLGVIVAAFLVLGVATRNGVLLIRDLQRREQADTHSAAGEIVLAGTREAAGPVLTTAVGIALVLLPFVVQGDVAGMEILRPLGVAVIGGLVTSSVLTLAIVPALYLRFVVRTPRADDQPQEGGA